MKNLKNDINENISKIKSSDLKLRMEIGSKGLFLTKYNRKGSELMHNFLTNQNIPHHYEVLKRANHWYQDFWNYPRTDSNLINGLSHLKYHLTLFKKD